MHLAWLVTGEVRAETSRPGEGPGDVGGPSWQVEHCRPLRLQSQRSALLTDIDTKQTAFRLNGRLPMAEGARFQMTLQFFFTPQGFVLEVK